MAGKSQAGRFRQTGLLSQQDAHMSAVDLPKEQDLVEYRVDRILEEANTDTRIVVLARQDGAPRYISNLGWSRRR